MMRINGLSKAQKLVIAVSLCLGLLLVFLQNPLAGYAFETPFLSNARPCSTAEKQEMRGAYQFAETLPNRSGYTPQQIEDKVRQCDTIVPEEAFLPFSEWRSIAPHVDWLGPVTHLLFSMLTVGLIASILVLSLRDTDSTKP